jgi:hypothetical protein
MLTAMRVGSLSALVSLVAVGAGCSIINAPDDLRVGAGGAASSATSSSSNGGSASGGGSSSSGAGGGGAGSGGSTTTATCTSDDDCRIDDLCKGARLCVDGACVADPPVLVEDGDACTKDSCDPATGKVTHEPISIDDGDACTVDSCDPVAGVKHLPSADLDDGNACTLDQCSSASDPPIITHTKLLGCGCAHSACSQGGPLDVQGCSWAPSAEGACVETVCASLEGCCTESWGSDCVDAVKTLCSPGGSGSGGGSGEAAIDCGCAHSYCVKGAALEASCDPCVRVICAKKPECCDAAQGGWTSDCVVATNTLCNAPPAPNCE